MSVDVRNQLRDYTRQLDQQVPTLEELMPPLVEPSPSHLRRPRWVPAVVAAVVVVLLIGGVALLVNWSGPENVIIDQPTSTTQLTTTTSTIPTTTSTTPPPVVESVTPPNAQVLPDYESNFPPLHMITAWGFISPLSQEIWYRDDNTWRMTTLDASDTALIGNYSLMADGFFTICQEDECWRNDETNDPDLRNTFEVQAWQVPLDLVAEHCLEIGEDVIGGRPARHFSCDSVWFEVGTHWRAITNSGADAQYWYDTGTDLLVRRDPQRVGDGARDRSFDVTLLEINPVFPDEIFKYRERQPAEVSP